MEIATWKIRPMPWKKSRSIPSQMRWEAPTEKNMVRLQVFGLKLVAALMWPERLEKSDPCRFFRPRQFGTQGVHERGPSLVGLVLCLYSRFLSFLRCSSRPSTKFTFPHQTLFHFICPHRPASWANRSWRVACLLISVCGCEQWNKSLTTLNSDLFTQKLARKLWSHFSVSPGQQSYIYIYIYREPRAVSYQNLSDFLGVKKGTYH